ncbi:unnamed protein product, partial [Pleuronectes platessa]
MNEGSADKRCVEGSPPSSAADEMGGIEHYGPSPPPFWSCKTECSTEEEGECVSENKENGKSVGGERQISPERQETGRTDRQDRQKESKRNTGSKRMSESERETSAPSALRQPLLPRDSLSTGGIFDLIILLHITYTAQ